MPSPYLYFSRICYWQFEFWNEAVKYSLMEVNYLGSYSEWSEVGWEELVCHMRLCPGGWVAGSLPALGCWCSIAEPPCCFPKLSHSCCLLGPDTTKSQGAKGNGRLQWCRVVGLHLEIFSFALKLAGPRLNLALSSSAGAPRQRRWCLQTGAWLSHPCCTCTGV
jgi:hypothetical protein